MKRQWLRYVTVEVDRRQWCDGTACTRGRAPFYARMFLYGTIQLLLDAVRIVQYEVFDVDVASVGCKVVNFDRPVQGILPYATYCAT